MTVNTVDDALVEINRLRAINQQLLAALQAVTEDVGPLLDLLDEAARLLDEGETAKTETMRALYRDAVQEAMSRLRGAL